MKIGMTVEVMARENRKGRPEAAFRIGNQL